MTTAELLKAANEAWDDLTPEEKQIRLVDFKERCKERYNLTKEQAIHQYVNEEFQYTI